MPHSSRQQTRQPANGHQASHGNIIDFTILPIIVCLLAADLTCPGPELNCETCASCAFPDPRHRSPLMTSLDPHPCKPHSCLPSCGNRPVCHPSASHSVVHNRQLEQQSQSIVCRDHICPSSTIYRCRGVNPTHKWANLLKLVGSTGLKRIRSTQSTNPDRTKTRKVQAQSRAEQTERECRPPLAPLPCTRVGGSSLSACPNIP